MTRASFSWRGTAACVTAAGALVACGGSSVPPAASHSAPSSTAVRPLESCVPPGAHAHEVTFSTGREQLVGAEFGSGSVGVVMSHEFMSDLCGWVPYATHIAARGYRALAFDFGFNLTADIAAAAHKLRNDGATTIVLMGASMGATSALSVAATASPPVAGVASLSGPQEYGGIDAMAAARQLRMPVVFMAAQLDQPYAQDAQTMYAACPSVRKQLAIYPGNDHGTQLLRYSVADQAQARLDSFLTSLSPAGS